MYAKLYNSTLAWYAKWYPEWGARNLVTALALTISIACNILTFVDISTMVGVYAPWHFFEDIKAATIPALVAVTILHLKFGERLAARAKQGADLNPWSRMVAIIYMATSGAVSIATFMLMVFWRVRP